MKMALGSVLLGVALSLVSVPAFAQQIELSLKYWHAGVGGADLWVADCSEYEDLYGGGSTGFGVHQLNGYPVDDPLSEETLVLQFGTGRSFILSGSYFLTPTVSVGVSYWGLGRADRVAKALDNNGAEFVEVVEEYGVEYHWSDKYYLLAAPWLDGDNPFRSCYWDNRYSEDLYYGDNCEGLLNGEGGLSMSALDISGMKALTGAGWEVGLSGGIRKATFNQNQSTMFESLYEEWLKFPGYDYQYSSRKYSLGLDSTLSVSAIGPQVGIEGTYALADKLALKAGAKAGLLFGTAQTDAKVKAGWWDYDPETSEWVLDLDEPDIDSEYPSTTDAIRIATHDLSAALAYHITEQWSVEAGYYASIWKGVPSLYCFAHNVEWGWNFYPIKPIYSEEAAWEQPEPRDITVSGLTLGVNFKF